MFKNRHLLTFIFLFFTCCLLLVTVNAFSEQATEADDLFVVEKAFEDGFYEISLGLLERFIKDYPQSELIPKANLLIGKCLFYKEKYLKALGIFKQLLDSDTADPIKDATLYWIAEVHFKGKDYQQARIYYQRLIDEFKHSSYTAFAHYSLAWSFFEEGEFSDAKRAFLELKQRFPQHKLAEDTDFKIALCFYNLKQYIQANENLDTYIKKYPDSKEIAEALFYKAECLYYLGDFKQAKNSYLMVIDKAGDDKLIDLAYVGLGWAYVKLEEYPQAEDIFNKVEKKNNKIYASSLLGRAEIHKQKQNFELALDFYNELIGSFPRYESISSAYFGKAECLYALLRYEEAISIYKYILGQVNRDKDKFGFSRLTDKAQYNLAWSYLKTGDFSQAISTFQRIADTSDDTIVKVSALCQIGDTYQDLGEYEKAIAAYDKILKDYPDSFYGDYVQYRASLCLLKMERFENAILGLKSIKINFPESRIQDEAEYYIGVAYFQRQDFVAACDQLDRFISSFPDSPLRPDGFYLKAVSLFNLGRYKEAQGVFTQLMKGYPQDLDSVIKCKFEIANCLYQVGEIRASVKKFKDILSRYPNSKVAPEVVFFLGEHYLSAGQDDVAIRYFKRLISDYPDSGLSSEAYYSLGWVYFQQNKYDDALAQFDRICQISGGQLRAQAILAIGDVYFKKDNLDESLRYYEQVLKDFPDFSREAYIKLADIYKKLGDYDKIIEAYRYALNKSSRNEAAQIQFKIAESLEESGEINEAAEAYLKNAYLYPQDKYWLIKSYLRLARIFENREDWYEAKNVYSKISAMDVEEAKFAREKLEWIAETLGNK